MPEELKKHLIPNSNRLRTFEDARREVVTYVEAKFGLRIRDAESGDAGPRGRSDPIDVDAVKSLSSSQGEGSSSPRDGCFMCVVGRASSGSLLPHLQIDAPPGLLCTVHVGDAREEACVWSHQLGAVGEVRQTQAVRERTRFFSVSVPYPRAVTHRVSLRMQGCRWSCASVAAALPNYDSEAPVRWEQDGQFVEMSPTRLHLWKTCCSAPWQHCADFSSAGRALQQAMARAVAAQQQSMTAHHLCVLFVSGVGA